MKMHSLAVPWYSRTVIIIPALVALVISLYSYSVFASTSSPLVPTADGNYTQWTPSTGASHFALVDETPCNTTDYNSTVVVGNRDSYTVPLSSVPNGATITQIDIKPCASRSAAGGTNPVMKVFYRTNGVNSADSASYTLSAGTSPAELATTSYSGLGIVKSATTTLESGAVLSSGTKGAKLSRIATTITYTALATPTFLSGFATTTSQIRISWNDTSSNETGFNVERSLNGTSWTPIATTSANVSSYYDSGLSSSTTYYHRVRAFNSGGSTAYSNTATTTTLATPPSAPTGISLSQTPVSSSTSDVNVSWIDNSSNELGFLVERRTTGAFSQIATTSANATTYVDAARPVGTYGYRVRAYNSGGNSAYTAIASTTVTGYVVPAPVSYWKLDESSGNASDAVGSNTLTNVGSSTYASAIINNGVVFVASSSQGLSISDAAQTGLDLDGTDFTVAYWMKLDSEPTGPGNVMFSKYSCCGDTATEGYVGEIYTDASGVALYLLMRNGAASSGIIRWSPGPTVGVWYHVAIVYSNSTGVAKLYVNGTQMGSDATGFGGIQNTSTDFAMGKISSVAGLNFDGSIDEFGVWHTALSASEIAALYNGGAGRPLSAF